MSHKQQIRLSFPEDSHANLIRLLAIGNLLVTSATSGQISYEFFGERGPDGFWRKTSQASFLLNLGDSSEEFSMTWPRSGTVLLGQCYRLQMPVPVISGSEYSLLPTAIPSHMSRHVALRPLKGRSLHGAELPDAIAMELLPTPMTSQNWKSVRRKTLREASRRHGVALPVAFEEKLPSLVDATGAALGLNPQFLERMMGFPDGWTLPD